MTDSTFNKNCSLELQKQIPKHKIRHNNFFLFYYKGNYV